MSVYDTEAFSITDLLVARDNHQRRIEEIDEELDRRAPYTDESDPGKETGASDSSGREYGTSYPESGPDQEVVELENKATEVFPSVEEEEVPPEYVRVLEKLELADKAEASARALIREAPLFENMVRMIANQAGGSADLFFQLVLRNEAGDEEWVEFTIKGVEAD